MTNQNQKRRAAWIVEQFKNDPSWRWDIYELDAITEAFKAASEKAGDSRHIFFDRCDLPEPLACGEERSRERAIEAAKAAARSLGYEIDP